MGKAKFTKGEWIADIRSGCCAVYEKSREDDSPGCHSNDERNIHYSSKDANYNGHHWVMSDEAHANAHLIAAAPAMYEMLENLHAHLDFIGDESYKNDICKLLAKARGD